MLLLLTKSN